MAAVHILARKVAVISELFILVGYSNCIYKKELHQRSDRMPDVYCQDDGSARITVVRSKTDAEVQGAVVAITPAAMNAFSAIWPAGVGGDEKSSGSLNPRRPAGEGYRQSCRLERLGVLQRP